MTTATSLSPTAICDMHIPSIGKCASDAAAEKGSNRISIPVPSEALLGDVSVVTPKGSIVSSEGRGGSFKEKVGRWSEEEHQVFLEGLDQHGKQWKIIAGMIGTRTVVQVRTHAQKYFQRIDRHLGKPKRKMSLPTSMPSSKKLKTGLKKGALQRSASIALGTSSSPTLDLQHTFPSYVSNASSMSSDCSWDTFSPHGVTETYEALDDIALESQPEAVCEGQDPLEWLIDAEPSILPESSLPTFPDLSPANAEDESFELTAATYHAAAAAAATVGVEPTTNALDSIADPNITVQSLFLLPDGTDNL